MHAHARTHAHTHTHTHTHTHLVVGAVRAGHKLPVRLAGREPGLQVVLLGGRVVELPTHNVHHAVRHAQRLGMQQARITAKA